MLGLPEDGALQLVEVLAALHDVGKFAPAFQAKSREHWPLCLGAYVVEPLGRTHTSDGLALWLDDLSERLPNQIWPDRLHELDVLAHAVFGHHGRPVARTLGPLFDLFGDKGRDAARQCTDDIVSLLLPSPLPDAIGGVQKDAASWWLAGVITLSDWLGSQSEFSYESGRLSLDEYLPIARERAQMVIDRCGILPARSAASASFSQLTGITETPSPLQEWASSVELPDGPLLFVLEDVTGSGKTEAAQMLVHRLMAANRVAGAYWAMPTQATANAMYSRQSRMLSRLFDPDGATPSLVLAHGQSRLHEGFRASVFGRTPGDSHPDCETSPEDLPSEVMCSAFLADDSRAAMLADVGAGTVDQAFLAVLPSRFNTMRLAGLGDKVIVLDEAHAYDAYMTKEAATLLAFQAALGGCAIVLSATLTVSQWTHIVRAWREVVSSERGSARSTVPTRSTAYPLSTSVSRKAVLQCDIRATERSHRRVDVRNIHSESEALDVLVDSLRLGGAVVWIRNTVAECLAAADAMHARGVEPIVFHARFAHCDRQRREEEVVRLFGRPDTNDPQRETRRRGRLLIATQVVEQSLDLDFDVMVSDLAPIDLLIQRAGRLWRHPARDSWRRERGFEPRLVVLCPELNDSPDSTWPAPLLPRVRRVYERVDVLWRTATALSGANAAIITPGTPGQTGGVRELIARVYDDPTEATPDALIAATLKAIGKEGVGNSTASFSVLKRHNGYVYGDMHWTPEFRATTRLGEERVTVRLARVDETGGLQPWFRDASFPSWKEWALSELTVGPWVVSAGARAHPNFAAAEGRLREQWNTWEGGVVVLPLIERGGLWTGSLVDEGKHVVYRYDVARGLSRG